MAMTGSSIPYSRDESATRRHRKGREAAYTGTQNAAPQICPEVLAALYTKHYAHVLQVCRRFFPRREDAEDAAADVFLKLFAVLSKKDESHAFRPWVCQVAGRHCIDKLRRRKNERNTISERYDLSLFPDAFDSSPLSQILHNEAKRQLRAELNRLPANYKVPLLLRYYKSMSYAEISLRLNHCLPTVKTILFRAKSRLRRNLAQC